MRTTLTGSSRKAERGVNQLFPRLAGRAAPYALRLLVLALIAGPSFAPAQKKDDILEIQRDVADLAEKVKALQKSQDEKMESLRQLIQQAVTASNQVTQDMSVLQRNLSASVSTSLNDQQGKITGAVAPLAAQMDALAQSVSALTQTVGQMNGRVGTIDTKLKDLSDKVSLLNQPAAPPPAPVNVTGPDASAAPPGVSRVSLWQDAEKDYGANNDQYAVDEYSKFIKYFKDDEHAPEAAYKIGMIYARQKDYDGAVQAFQDVIANYPGMNRSQDALYQKAKALAAAGHKTEAVETYSDFINRYPANDYVTQARSERSKLMGSPASKQTKGRGAAK